MVAGVVAAGVIGLQAAGRTTDSGGPSRPADSASSVPVPPRRSAEVTVFDRTAHSTSDPTSIWVIVNKSHPIDPLVFRPVISLVRGYQVASAVAGPLRRLLDDGDARGLGLKIASAFRSYDYQRRIHDGLVATSGAGEADRVSARPGHSEHQTGLAVDLVTPADPSCDLDACFANTPAGRWIAANAWRYGFVIRYQPAVSTITGYAPEPWHLRYVGRPLAAELRRTDTVTLEQFFGVRGGRYPSR